MMSLAYWFILVGGLMPYALVQVARGRGFDNSKPRDNYAQVDGLQKRAYWAHLNSLEVFPLFAVAVIAATLAGANTQWVDVLAGLWLLSRAGYIFAYLKDMPTVRSAVFGVGLAIVLAIFTLPLWGPYPEGF